MHVINGKVEAIAAGPEQIAVTGEWAGAAGAALRLYERPAHLGAEAALAPCTAALSWALDDRGAADAAAGRFTLITPRFVDGRDRLYARFYVTADAGEDEPARLPGVCCVTALEGVAAADYPYPAAPTIKGLQVHMVDDALALGVGHAALNLNMGTIMRPGPTAETLPFVSDGRTFYFDAAYLARFDARLKELSDHGIVVNLILLNSPHWDGVRVAPELRAALLHPGYDPAGFISAFNVVSAEGLAHYRAFVEFVAARYTRPDAAYGRACGFIIGNEVDSQWVWANAGEMSAAEYAAQYAIALRTAFYAARKQYAQARVYVSLDHFWTRFYQDNPRRCYPGREIIETLAAQAQAEGDFDWSLAYHPYPQDLFHPDFWRDTEAWPTDDTPRITFKNIGLLPEYMGRPHLRYAGRLRHIILSEQGFHSDETEAGEQLQAAAYAYAYWKISRTPGIESFILHAHVDNRDEFDLNLGLWRRDKASPLPSQPGSPKPIHAVFRQVDGPECEAVFAWAKEIVGAENWVS